MDPGTAVFLGFVQRIEERLGAGFDDVGADALAVIRAAVGRNLDRDLAEGVFALETLRTW